jgi:hypothetical protein
MKYIILLMLLLGTCVFLFPDEYIREQIYDTSVHRDEALVNVKIANSRWVDCTTLTTAIHDMFRLEGVENKNDQAKALALWKWFRILVSSTGGGYQYEETSGKPGIVRDPHKIFAVYGHHQCDGLSWAMVPLWRAAGYMAHDCCTWGHTTAALRYKDDDGVYRYHNLDPQYRYYYWDSAKKIIGARSMPIMTNMVYRHVTTPINFHSLRTSLRIGETIERFWDNKGNIIPSGKDKIKALTSSYYAYTPGKTNGIYAAVGEQVQIIDSDTNPARYDKQLYTGSENTACSAPEKGKASLHPEKKDETAVFIYRAAPPYVIADAQIDAELVKENPEDICTLSFSIDKKGWKPLYDKKTTGTETVSIDLGFKAWKDKKPNVYTGYDFFIKAEFRTSGDVRSVGMNKLRIKTIRMLNKRTLPNLRPGKNCLKVSADSMPEKYALKLAVMYSVKGKQKQVEKCIAQFPYYFMVDVPDAKPHITGNYDQSFNTGELRMISYSMCLTDKVPSRTEPSLNEKDVIEEFKKPSPHPSDMNRKKVRKPFETDPIQTNGFFPQSRAVLHNTEKMQGLLRNISKWKNAQELGNYPAAVTALCKTLPKANGDQTLFIVKALAQIGDPAAVEPLLKKWERAPKDAPGSRYIPDALAAIGDQRAVPALIKPLKRLRFDFRFHIAYALSVLGGPEAREALKELAQNDPFPAVREFAQRALDKGIPDKAMKMGRTGKKITGPFRLLRAHERAVCPDLTEAPVLDGNLTDKEWKQAAVLSDFVPDTGTGTFDYPTIAYIGKHRDMLYVGIECGGQPIDSIKASADTPPGKVWTEDSVEIFVDPQHNHKDYYQFMLNAKGVMHLNTKAKQVKGIEWKAVTKLYDKGWRAEIAIPFALFPQKPGQIIGLNISRNVKEKGIICGQWSPTSGDSHAAGLFSDLVFNNESKFSFKGRRILNSGTKPADIKVTLKLGKKQIQKELTVEPGKDADIGIDTILKHITSLFNTLLVEIDSKGQKLISIEYSIEKADK